MKPIYILLLILLSCNSKEVVDDNPLHLGCVKGTNKTTGKANEFIFCVPYELYQTGTNQTAANIVADKLNVPRVDVSVRNNYTSITHTENKACNCN